MKKILCLLCTLMLIIFPFAQEKGDSVYDTQIYKLAETYIGMKGDCFQVAQKFLREYYNDDSYVIRVGSWDEVDYDNLKPGDVIFYSKSPVNTTHWAVYLGGGLALNGNCFEKGVSYAKILNVFLENASYPVFYHKPNSNEFKFDFSLLSLA